MEPQAPKNSKNSETALSISSYAYRGPLNGFSYHDDDDDDHNDAYHNHDHYNAYHDHDHQDDCHCQDDYHDNDSTMSRMAD